MVAVVAVPPKVPTNVVHVSVEVDGLYVRGVVVSSTYSPVLLIPLLNKMGYDPMVLSTDINTLVALVAVPENEPEKVGAANIEVLGLYVMSEL